MSTRPLLRRMSGTLGACAFAGLAVVAAQAPSPTPDHRRDAAPTAPTQPSTPAAPSTPRIEPAPVPRSTQAPARSRGAGITAPGVSAVTYISSSGVLDVSERIKLPEKTSTVTVRTFTSGLPVVKKMRPEIENLQIDAAGEPVAASAMKVPGSVRLTLPQETDTLAVRYQVTGATQHSNPAPAGRIISALPLIVPEFGPSTPAKVTIDMTNTGVLNLTCPLMPTMDQMCGIRRGDAWTTREMPWKQAFALAQVNLPSPGQS